MLPINHHAQYNGILIDPWQYTFHPKCEAWHNECASDSEAIHDNMYACLIRRAFMAACTHV